MTADLFTLLDRDWQDWQRRPIASNAFARWSTAAPRLACVGSFDELFGVFEDRRAYDEHDTLLLALMSLTAVDGDAQRAVLQVLRAGLVALAVRARNWLEWDDASSVVIVAALDRIPRYPAHRTSRVAANLLGDIWHSVWAERQIELRHRAGDHRIDVQEIDNLADSDEPRRGDELMTLIDEAVQRRRITACDGRLVALHRVLGYTNVEVGRMEGKQPCTIRKRRLAAEAAITALAVA